MKMRVSKYSLFLLPFYMYISLLSAVLLQGTHVHMGRLCDAGAHQEIPSVTGTASLVFLVSGNFVGLCCARTTQYSVLEVSP